MNQVNINNDQENKIKFLFEKEYDGFLAIRWFVSSFLFLMYLFLPSQSHAYGLTGLYRGDGILKIENDPADYPCIMIMEIEHQPDSYWVKISDFDCKVMRFKNKNNGVLKIQDGRMITPTGIDVGLINETEMISDLKVNKLRQFYSLLKNSDLSLNYEDSVQWSPQMKTEIKGILIPVSRSQSLPQLK